ncbi:hypothetical protein COOONC_16169 [Cooperia oncophora]
MYSVVRSTCIKLIFGYVFLHCMQTGLMATIAVDLLISITFPLWHRVTRNNIYVSLISIPSALYGLLSVILGFLMTNDDHVNLCNPPSSLYGKAKSFWYIVAFIAGVNVSSLNPFCPPTRARFGYAIYIIIPGKRHINQPQDFARRTMRSMSIIVVIFLCTRFLATVGANILNMGNVDPHTVELFQNYCVSFRDTLRSGLPLKHRNFFHILHQEGTEALFY